MRQIDSLSGQGLRDMLMAATEWLERNASEIDALNVFPVPDGDTGTNMLLTMHSTIEEAYRAPDHSTSAVAEAIAKGALMGARGNSGVILSQIWHGLAKGLAGKDCCTGKDLAEALLRASTEAYNGIANPVEGTILTVARQAASDTILEGALHYLKGETNEFQSGKPGIIISNMAQLAKTPQMVAADENPYGYCTCFIIKGWGLDPEKLRRKLKKKGESLIVVGDQSTIRVHIHTLDPGGIIHLATSLGTVHQVSIQNMDEQHEGFVEMQKERMVTADIVVVAVVSGDGLADVFTSLGAVVVPGGRTMNPSTNDLLQAVKSVASDKIIILPNNKNVIPAARQVRSLTDKTIKVLATTTIPQGIAALLAFNTEVDLETSITAMKKAQSAVRSIAITQAARSVRLVGLHIKKKQPIGFLDGDLVAASDSATDTLNEVLSKLNLSDAEIITIYYRGDEERVEVGSFITAFREQYPHLQIELVRGGQPHYHYIVSVE